MSEATTFGKTPTETYTGVIPHLSDMQITPHQKMTARSVFGTPKNAEHIPGPSVLAPIMQMTQVVAGHDPITSIESIRWQGALSSNVDIMVSRYQADASYDNAIVSGVVKTNSGSSLYFSATPRSQTAAKLSRDYQPTFHDDIILATGTEPNTYTATLDVATVDYSQSVHELGSVNQAVVELLVDTVKEITRTHHGLEMYFVPYILGLHAPRGLKDLLNGEFEFTLESQQENPKQKGHYKLTFKFKLPHQNNYGTLVAYAKSSD